MRNLAGKISTGDLVALKSFGVMFKAHVQFEEREFIITAETILPANYLDQHA